MVDDARPEGDSPKGEEETEEMAEPSQPVVSVGAGIAIFGIWLAGAAITITILLMIHHGEPPKVEKGEEASVLLTLIVLVLMAASPMIAAYKMTEKILDKR